MTESQEMRLKNIGKTKDYFNGEINGTEFISNKHRKVCKILSYINTSFFWLLWLLVSFYWCFASLAGFSASTTSSVVGIKTSAITSIIKKY